MENKRRIPYGVVNWAELVRECFVVDNTRYIRELETVKTPVFLRPKRFGKSIVCSMLAQEGPRASPRLESSNFRHCRRSLWQHRV